MHDLNNDLNSSYFGKGVRHPGFLHWIPRLLVLFGLLIPSVYSLAYIYAHGAAALSSATYAEKVQLSTSYYESDDPNNNSTYTDTLFNCMDEVVLISADGVQLTGSEEEVVTSAAFYNLTGSGYASSDDTHYLTDIYGELVMENTYSVPFGIRRLEEETGGITLTLNSQVQEVMYQYLTDYGAEGFIAAYDYTTGEMIVCVSTPGVSSSAAVSDEDLADGTLYNKALYATGSGSTQKLTTLVLLADQGAALEELRYTCTGSYTLEDGSVIKCTDVHGEQGVESALCNSCNAWFAQAITGNLDIHDAGQTLQDLGFSVNGSEAEAFVDMVPVSPSSITLSEEDGWSFENTWALIGEIDIQISCFYMLELAASLAASTEENGTVSGFCTPVFLTSEGGAGCTLFDDFEEEIETVGAIWKGASALSGSYPSFDFWKSGTYEKNNDGSGDIVPVQKNFVAVNTADHIAVWVTLENYRVSSGATLGIMPADAAEVTLQTIRSVRSQEKEAAS